MISQSVSDIAIKNSEAKEAADQDDIFTVL